MPFLPGSREIADHFSPPLLSPLKEQDGQDDARVSAKKDQKAQPGQIHSPACHDPG
jgi:hypothetical protein